MWMNDKIIDLTPGFDQHSTVIPIVQERKTHDEGADPD